MTLREIVWAPFTVWSKDSSYSYECACVCRSGFDLKFIQAYPHFADDLQRETEALCARLITYPKPTVAAVNGHACAAGAMLMLTFDAVVMNKERGFCFVPGVDLGLTYSNGMVALMAAKLPVAIRHGMIVYSERFDSVRLAEHHVVTAAPADDVLSNAVSTASKLALKAATKASRAALAHTKATLYHEAVAALQVRHDEVVRAPAFVPMGFDRLEKGVDRRRRASLGNGVQIGPKPVTRVTFGEVVKYDGGAKSKSMDGAEDSRLEA